MPTRLAFLWHMHQPMYTDPGTGEAILPWVRLHATHAYYDMGRILERHPAVRCTVNFVPSLLEQLEACAKGSVKERYLEMSRKAPEEMTDEERLFVVRQFFMADRERCVRPLPHYLQLLERRGDDPHRIDLGRFSAQDVRDIQCFFNLVWMGFAARKDEPEVARLLAQGGGYSEEDKASLLAAQQRVLESVVPLWRRLSERGQVELSSTPYFHPILPLLCDSDSARRAMPHAQLPPRFVHPEDAHEQVRLAVERHTQMFGQPPKGMWPAEGSVSPEALAVFAQEGIGWLATDEGILFRSHPAPVARGQLYQGWNVDAGEGRSVRMVFRDRPLSDRIGFTYAHQSAQASVEDFLAHLRRGEADAKKAGLTEPLIPVVLDGENAWEHYEGQGEPFLDLLYRTLASTPELQTVTMSEALAHPTAHLPHIHSGSWIESNFRIWISHPEDNLGWELLGRVRHLVAHHEKKGDVDPQLLAQAKRMILSAEGSDWFWWYGEDFQTENAAEFDQLFRDRLLRAAALVGEPAPWRLSEPISGRARAQATRVAAQTPFTALISPHVDGMAGPYTKWLGAGRVRPETGHGAMYQSTSGIDALLYGCDLTTLYLRLEPHESLAGAQLQIDVANGRGATHKVHARLQPDSALALDLHGAHGRYGEVIELALPLAKLTLVPHDRAELVVRLLREGAEQERLPRGGPLAFEVPDGDFERRDWLL